MENKNRILEVADILFADKGYQLSMSDIASEVGIKVPSIYSHYSGKDEIIFCIVKKEIERFYTCIFLELNQHTSHPYDEILQDLYYFALGYYSKDNRLRFWRNISLIQNEDLKKQCIEYMNEQEKALHKDLEAFFKEGILKGDLKGKDSKKMVTFYLIVIRGVMDWMIVYQNSEYDRNEFFREIWDEYLTMKQK